MFDERKVAQSAAYFLLQQGGQMPNLKLAKLLYLADRESLSRYGYQISGDRLVSMPHGPVLSITNNLMNGDLTSCEDGWASLMLDREDYEIALQDGISIDRLKSLSVADREILDCIWTEFGHLNKWQIRDYTHTLPEWEDPDGSSNPIRFRDVLLAMGKSFDQAKAAESSESESASLMHALADI